MTGVQTCALPIFAQTVLGIDVMKIYKGIIPFLVIYLIALAIITYVPSVSLLGVRLLIGP